MIAPSCAAWTRIGLRRMPNAPCPRNTTSGTSFERARTHVHPSNVTRRYHFEKSNGGGRPTETAQSIPGPSWLWLEPIIEPFRAYGRVQQRRPYRTQLISSLVIYFIGDLVAQSIAPADSKEPHDMADDAAEKGWVQEWGDNRDWARTGRALIIGGLSSIPSYKWFLWLSNNFNYSSKILTLSTKVFINQTFFTPLFNSYFFGMQSLLCGATLPEMLERIRNTVPTSWYNSWKIWPAVTAFSFSYVPIQYRSIFGGVIAIGWQTYLSLLNTRAEAKEEMEHSAAHDAPVSVRTTQRAEQGLFERKCAV